MKLWRKRVRCVWRAVVCAALAGIITGVSRPARAEDVALVIGINQYPRLLKGAGLKGSIRDAERMRDALKDRGFTVTLLTDKKASRRDIEENLKRISKNAAGGDRFVCYFSGYGATNVLDESRGKREQALLPSDARDNSSENDLPLTTLHQTINKLPCAVKALILDTSFSGALLGDEKGNGKGKEKLRPRFYLRSSQARARLWQISDPTNADSAEAGVLQGSTVLFTASLQNQVAYESTDKNGGGVFTTALLDELKSKPGRWQEVQARVAAKVVGATESRQTPILQPVSFLYRSVLSAAPAPPGPGEISLRDLYNMSRPSASVVTLRITPNKTRLVLMEPIQFKVNVGIDGYLLLINSDPLNRVQLVWPADKPVEAARVRKGVLNVPIVGQADTPGDDHLKAFWFPLSARDSVMALLKALQSEAGGDPARTLLPKSRLSSVLFATSELHTRIEIPPVAPSP